MNLIIRVASLVLLILPAVSAIAASAPLTSLSERVTDLTGKLSPDSLSCLSSSIEEGDDFGDGGEIGHKWQGALGHDVVPRSVALDLLASPSVA